MQAATAEFSGYAGKFSSFWREDLKTRCLDSFIFKPALRPTRTIFTLLLI
jgi:hypothetical protein